MTNASMDTLLLAVLLLAFATLVTAHVTLSVGLALRAPRWRALVAFCVPPLAPYWGFRAGMPVRAIAWIVSAAAYAIALARALR